MYRDSVNFENLFKLDSFDFLVANKELGLEGTIPDGVLGIGYDRDNKTKTSFINALVNQGAIDKHQFSIYLTGSPVDSRLLLGSVLDDPSFKHLSKQMSTCNIPSDSPYWACSLNSVTLKDTSVSLKSEIVFDSGTSYIVIPFTDFKELNKAFLGGFKCGISNFNRIMCECASPTDFPVMELSIGGNPFKIHPTDYIEFFPMYQDYQCRFQIMVDVFAEGIWILGDSALRYSLVTFDKDASQIKFCQNPDQLNVNIEPAESSDNWFYWFVATLVLFILYIVVRR